MNLKNKVLNHFSVFLAILLSTFCIHTSASTITVDTLVDDFVDNGNCTLREAITAANTNSARDQCVAGEPEMLGTVVDVIQIRLKNEPPVGLRVDSDLPYITESLKIVGSNIDQRIYYTPSSGLGCSGDIGVGGLLNFVGQDPSPSDTSTTKNYKRQFIIENLTLTNGRRSCTDRIATSLYSYGGCIAIFGLADVVIDHVKINNCWAQYGAGIGWQNMPRNDDPSMQKSLVSSLTISNSEISGNNTYLDGKQGGGIALIGQISAEISRSTIAYNSAKFKGGGIYMDADQTLNNSPTLYRDIRFKMTQSTVAHNSTRPQIANSSGALTATSRGAGLYLANSTIDNGAGESSDIIVDLYHNTIFGNLGNDGNIGGVTNNDVEGLGISFKSKNIKGWLANNAIFGNYDARFGDVADIEISSIFNRNNNQVPEIYSNGFNLIGNVTNNVDSGIGACALANLTLHDGCEDEMTFRGAATNDYSVTGTVKTGSQYFETNNIADNGGPTRTLMPRSGSQLLDIGLCESNLLSPPLSTNGTDQRGFTTGFSTSGQPIRQGIDPSYNPSTVIGGMVTDNGCDIGSVERVALTPHLDIDSDGIINELDNCIVTPNTDQVDFDNDGWGDACSLEGEGSDETFCLPIQNENKKIAVICL